MACGAQPTRERLSRARGRGGCPNEAELTATIDYIARARALDRRIGTHISLARVELRGGKLSSPISPLLSPRMAEENCSCGALGQICGLAAKAISAAKMLRAESSAKAVRESSWRNNGMQPQMASLRWLTTNGNAAGSQRFRRWVGGPSI